jgi:hypothetical protein
MSPEEALDFGILDEVVASRPIPDDDDNGDGGDDGTDKKGKKSDGG